MGCAMATEATLTCDSIQCSNIKQVIWLIFLRQKSICSPDLLSRDPNFHLSLNFCDFAAFKNRPVKFIPCNFHSNWCFPNKFFQKLVYRISSIRAPPPRPTNSTRTSDPLREIIEPPGGSNRGNTVHDVFEMFEMKFFKKPRVVPED